MISISCNPQIHQEKLLLPRRRTECWEGPLPGWWCWSEEEGRRLFAWGWADSAGVGGKCHCLPTLCWSKDILAWQLHGKSPGPRQGHLPPFLTVPLIHSVTLATALSFLNLSLLTCNRDRGRGLQSYQWPINLFLAPEFYFLNFFAIILERAKPSHLTLSQPHLKTHFLRQADSKGKYKWSLCSCPYLGITMMIIVINLHAWLCSLQSTSTSNIHILDSQNNPVRWE